MQTVDLEQDLQDRIDQSTAWLESGELSPILGLRLRSYPCSAEPIKFIDDRAREEKHGIKFRLEWVGASKDRYESFIEVRIKPSPSKSRDGKSIANPPYIVTYAVNPETGKRDEMTCEHLEIPESYRKTLPLSIKEWYAHWLDLALRHKNVSKIFRDKQRIL